MATDESASPYPGDSEDFTLWNQELLGAGDLPLYLGRLAGQQPNLKIVDSAAGPESTSKGSTAWGEFLVEHVEGYSEQAWSSSRLDATNIKLSSLVEFPYDIPFSDLPVLYDLGELQPFTSEHFDRPGSN